MLRQRRWRRLLLLVLGVLATYTLVWLAAYQWGRADCEQWITRQRMAPPRYQRIPFDSEQHTLPEVVGSPFPNSYSYAVDAALLPLPLVIRVDYFEASPTWVGGSRDYFVWLFGYKVRLRFLSQEGWRESFNAGGSDASAE